MHSIKRLCLRLCHMNPLLSNNTQTRFFDFRVDSACQVTTCGIWLDDRKGTLSSHKDNPLSVGGAGRPAKKRCCAPYSKPRPQQKGLTA